MIDARGRETYPGSGVFIPWGPGNRPPQDLFINQPPNGGGGVPTAPAGGGNWYWYPDERYWRYYNPAAVDIETGRKASPPPPNAVPAPEGFQNSPTPPPYEGGRGPLPEGTVGGPTGPVTFPGGGGAAPTGAPTDWITKGNTKYSPSTGQVFVWDGTKWSWYDPQAPSWVNTLSPQAARTAMLEAGGQVPGAGGYPGGWQAQPAYAGGARPLGIGTVPGYGGGLPGAPTSYMGTPGALVLGQQRTNAALQPGSPEYMAAQWQRNQAQQRARMEAMMPAGGPQSLFQGWRQQWEAMTPEERARMGAGGTWPTPPGGTTPGAPTPGQVPVAPAPVTPAPAPRPVPPPLTGYVWNRLLPSQQQGLQGYVESLGVPWGDYGAASQRLAPAWGMPEEATWGAPRQY